MARIAATLLVLSLFISCTGARKPETETTHRGYTVFCEKDCYVIVDVPFEEAWGTTLFALEDREWPFETVDEASLAVTTAYVAIGTNDDAGACYLSGAGFSQFKRPDTQAVLTEMRCRLIIRLAPSGEATTQVRALAEVQGKFNVRDLRETGREGSITEWLGCESTGEIEREFFDSFLTRLEPTRYDPPVYRRVR